MATEEKKQEGGNVVDNVSRPPRRTTTREATVDRGVSLFPIPEAPGGKAQSVIPGSRWSR